jgi:hypothetical protein
MAQNFKNHRRLNAAHHFILTPLTSGLFVWSIVHWTKEEDKSVATWMVLTSFALILITLIARSYGLKNQDRIIRMEMRQRYFHLSGSPFTEKEKQLKLSQIIALRFAGDQELLELIDRAIQEKLTPTDIKKAITDWVPDENRV